MNESDLISGLNDLDQLARVDYRKSLPALFNDQPEGEAVRQLERLIGVSLKAPFAEPEVLLHPSAYSQAYRGWNLDEQKFASPEAASTWQYHTLEAIWREPENAQQFSTLIELARYAHNERGFFGYLAQSLQKYICSNPEIRKVIKDSVKHGEAAGFNVKLLSPEQLVQAGGLALGSYLIAHVAILGLVGAPVIAGVVLLFYTIGVDAFCSWAKDTGDLERH